MVAEESDGSFHDDETDENFCEPPFKQRKNSEQILLRMPRITASTSQVVMAAERHKVSSNALNDILVAIIKESQGCVDFMLSQMSSSRERQKLRSKKFEF